GLWSRFRLQRESIDVGEDREIGFTLATGDRESHRLLERVGATDQQLDDFVGGRLTAAPEVVEQILQAMGQIGDAAVPHRRRHAFDRMHRAEQAADRLRRRRLALPLEQQLIAGAQVLAALGQEQLGVLREIHGYPRTRCTASSTREGWNGLTTKSLAPAWMASTTSACCPMALHIRILASGSCLTISRPASMPPRSGITMSIVRRSGLSCRYFSTAWVPVSASPTTSNPACPRMSLIIVRMKMASSQTRTVWLTARSLGSQNRAQQRRDIQYDEQFSVPPAHSAYQRGIDARQALPAFQRVVAGGQHIQYFVNRKADQLAQPVFPPPASPGRSSEFEDKRRAQRAF